MFNLTNPFRRADKHGAPDMRVTAPASAEMPMMHPGRGNRTITLPSAMVPAEGPGGVAMEQCGRCRRPIPEEWTRFVNPVTGIHYHASPARDCTGTDFHERETGIARD